MEFVLDNNVKIVLRGTQIVVYQNAMRAFKDFWPAWEVVTRISNEKELANCQIDGVSLEKLIAKNQSAWEYVAYFFHDN